MNFTRVLNNKTKILCTVGPAISSVEKIVALIQAGANAFRLNMSHSSHQTHLESIRIIREAEKQLQYYVPIIADLQGPKLRVADLGVNGGINLIPGREMYLADTDYVKNNKLSIDEVIPVTYPTVAKDVKIEDAILFDDGLLKVQVIGKEGELVKVVVINGGLLKSRKGMNLPNTNFSQSVMTEKDAIDLKFAIENKVDYVAASFVRTASDVLRIRKFMQNFGVTIPIISKIEKPEAIVNLEKIIQVSDGVMVARGDLGVEISSALVPIVQKKIISMCNAYFKPVITATQMLESMIQNPRPTRAEASDVANAVFDGTDAVMLSAETSVGAYPIEAVTYMRMICSETERELHLDFHSIQYKTASKEHKTDAIASAAATMSSDPRISGIATLSLSGETALLISKRRPNAPLISFSEKIETVRRVGLYWGTTGFLIEQVSTTDQTIEDIKQMLVKRKFYQAGTNIVITIGRPLQKKSRTNMLSIETL